MAKSRMDVTAFVGKLLKEDDADVLREGVQVLSQALMEAEVSAQIGALPLRAQLREERLSQRLPDEDVGYARRNHRAQDPQGHRGQLLPEPARVAATGREGSPCRGRGGLRQGNLDPQGRRSRQGARYRRHL